MGTVVFLLYPLVQSENELAAEAVLAVFPENNKPAELVVFLSGGLVRADSSNWSAGGDEAQQNVCGFGQIVRPVKVRLKSE